MNTNNHKIGGWLAGLFFPVASFVYALFHPNDKNFRLLFVLFFTFVGLAFFYKGDEADVTRSVVDFLDVASDNNISFITFFNSIALSQQIDYYSTFMLWLVSRFTNNPKIFLGILAFVYSLFFVMNVNYLNRHLNTNTKFGILLLVLFISVPKIMFLTHRWWTALQVFLYGLLPVVFEKKYWKLLWCFAAAYLIHFSFLYPLILFLFSLLLPKKNLLAYLIIYIVSLIMNSFDFTVYAPYIDQLFPELVADRTSSYITAEKLEHNFFSQSARFAMNIANAVLCVVIYSSNKEYLKNKDLLCRFFVTALLLGTFANLTSLTEWGWRYLDLTNMLFVAFYIVYLSDETCYKKSLVLFRCVSPLFLYFIVFQIRGFLTIIGTHQLLFGNYFTTWFLEDTNSIWYSIM